MTMLNVLIGANGSANNESHTPNLHCTVYMYMALYMHIKHGNTLISLSRDTYVGQTLTPFCSPPIYTNPIPKLDCPILHIHVYKRCSWEST